MLTSLCVVLIVGLIGYIVYEKAQQEQKKNDAPFVFNNEQLNEIAVAKENNNHIKGLGKAKQLIYNKVLKGQLKFSFYYYEIDLDYGREIQFVYDSLIFEGVPVKIGYDRENKPYYIDVDYPIKKKES